ncbi:MAG: ABC transporter permease subunit [Chloroflexota bacterium]|jgi:phosphonate transport system permease protein
MLKLDFFARQRLIFAGAFALVIGISYGSIMVTEYDVVKGITSIPKAFSWLAENFIPNDAAMKRLPKILEKLQETILVSISSATVASALALIVALLGSNTTRINQGFSIFARGTATIFRNIDVSAWALILLFSFGQSSFTGYFALFFVTFGFMVRVLIETIDEVSSESVEALRATGASYTSIITQSVIPSCIPQMVSWILFMIETNIRSATLVGILTGTGIGFSFDLYYKSMNYSAASLVILVIVITVLIIEFFSNSVRRAVL